MKRGPTANLSGLDMPPDELEKRAYTLMVGMLRRQNAFNATLGSIAGRPDAVELMAAYMAGMARALLEDTPDGPLEQLLGVWLECVPLHMQDMRREVLSAVHRRLSLRKAAASA